MLELSDRSLPSRVLKTAKQQMQSADSVPPVEVSDPSAGLGYEPLDLIPDLDMDDGIDWLWLSTLPFEPGPPTSGEMDWL